MSDETTKNEDSDEGPVGGERLRIARRANDISVRDVAKELHLDEFKVRALEKNDFDVLGAPVFAKGHLRKYAEMVGVPVDDVMTDYYQMNRATGAPPVVGPRRKPARDLNLGPWIAGALVVLLVVGAAWWFFVLRPTGPVADDAPQAPGMTTGRPATPPAGTGERDEAPDEPDPEPAAAASPEPETAPSPSATSSTAQAPVRAAPATAEYQPTPGVPQLDMVLSYSGDCWTEVSDGAGRRLFYDLGAEGRVVRLSGDAPFRLILGDADNVRLTVDGAPWPIPASARRGRLARLTIAPR